MSDEVPDPLAAFDQLLRAVVDVAKGVYAYYTALIEEGFTPEQALTLTAGFQHTLVTGGKSEP